MKNSIHDTCSPWFIPTGATAAAKGVEFQIIIALSARVWDVFEQTTASVLLESEPNCHSLHRVWSYTLSIKYVLLSRSTQWPDSTVFVMASPPYRSPATSPPYPPHTSLPNPKKRPSVHVPPYPPSLKRQKRSSVHSSASSAHPLRQTSFPPEESAIITGERSPSVDSEITNITGKGSLPTAGGRRRKSKGKGKRAAASVKSGVKEKTVDGREGTGEVPDDDDEEDDDGGDDVVDGVEEEDREAEKKKLA